MTILYRVAKLKNSRIFLNRTLGTNSPNLISAKFSGYSVLPGITICHLFRYVGVCVILEKVHHSVYSCCDFVVTIVN